MRNSIGPHAFQDFIRKLPARFAAIPSRRRRRRRSWGQLENLEGRQVLAAVPIISEFLASNDQGIKDVDQDDSDYIELYNAGDEDMSLNRWYLTDNVNDLQKWRLPDVDLAAGAYRLVFASGKDRNDPAGELHTNFSLSTNGEYLALVEPDGQTIAFEYKPTYPRQVTDVSYGIPTGIKYQTVVGAGTSARLLIPTSGALDPVEPDVIAGTWLDPNANDTAAPWSTTQLNVGFVPPDEPVVLADSVADYSGVQGKDNWSYGTWTKNFDGDKLYASSEFNPINAERFFNPTTQVWDLAPPGSSPSTELNATGGHPSAASVGFFTHWAIRRWTAETTGEVRITGTLADSDPAGDGVVGRITVNGREIYQQLVSGNSVEFDVTAVVAVGDVLDFIIDPGAADNEVGDATTFTAKLVGKPLRTLPEVAMADSSSDWSRQGIQGTNSWYLGIYDRQSDADRTYQPANFTQFPSAAWGSSRFQWPDTAYVTDVRSTAMTPTANAGGVHWSMRRWVSTVDGTLVVNYDVAKNLAGGDGVTARLFHNGTQVDSVGVAGDDRVGTTRRVTIKEVKKGDAIDFAIDPLGPGIDPQAINGTDDRTNVDVRIARVADLGQVVDTDLRQAMQGIASSAYLRIPFQVEKLSDLDQILFSIRYDDGYVAYINGHEVASGNAPDVAVYNSTALGARSPQDATLTETIDLTNRKDVFVPGENVLQIHALNSSANDDELLLAPELTIGTLTIDATQARYFTTPTPGAANGLGAVEVGPLVSESSHTPNVPQLGEPIVVTARVSRTFHDITDVQLTYRVMYGERITIPMSDDGQNGDPVANDGLFTATIPGNAGKAGEMVRWFVTATDNTNLRGRFPAFADPTNSQEFLGTIVADPTAVSNLPVFHWFVERFNLAVSATGTSGSLFYDGEFYDNVFMNLHGQSSSGFPTQKKSMNVDMPSDHPFRLRDDLPRMKDIDLLTNFADKSKVRNTIAYEQLAMSGGAYHLAFPIRLHRNGQFYAVYDFMENADEAWLTRMGLDPRNSLYKIYNVFDSVSGAEKKAGIEPTTNDLRDAIAGVRAAGGAKLDYIFDNVNLAQMANFAAGFVITSNVDCCHKNYYAYRDTYGTGEWWFFPWDQDLSQGRVWSGGPTYYDDTMFPNTALYTGSNNNLMSALFSQVPGFKDMYLRRIRTLMDQYVKPPGTPADQLPLETRVEELRRLMKVDADLDNELNPARWGQTGFQTFDQAVDILLNDYSGPRRKYLYENLALADPGNARRLISGVPGAATGRYFVPTDGSLGKSWTQRDFNDAAWASGPLGIGMEVGTTNYTDLIKTDLQAQLAGKTSVYIRVPFNVDDPAAIKQLSLRMKYEDGYVAYLNGVEVARKNLVQAEPTFDSTARSRATSAAQKFENVILNNFLSELKPGNNVLAIHAINNSAGSTDVFVLPELVEATLSNGDGEIPAAQIGNPKIDFVSVEYAPASGNQNEEYIQLTNPNNASVDISGWKLTGSIDKTFDPGTVLPAGYTMYVSPDAKAFRARTTGPRGGQRLFVQGNYSGRLPNEGGHVELVALDGTIINQFTYTGSVSPLQESLRVTEVMYHPLDASAAELARDNSLVSEDFEYIELTNISNQTTLDLTGAKFTQGIEFDFTNGQIKQLQPGERVLVVRNAEAFAVRYGNELSGRIAGEFAANTALRDAGETIALLGGDGAVVADFAYDDRPYQGWPALADGHGSSLQIVDVQGSYNEPANWVASREIHGSPGRTPLAGSPGLVINEVRARTDSTASDAIELHNPTNQTISLQGYFLSDTSRNADLLGLVALPDYRIAAGGYLVLDGSQFSGRNGFGLSGADGDDIFLTWGNQGVPTQMVDHVTFGGSPFNTTLGRATEGFFAPLTVSTLASANSGPRVGPLVITEIVASPANPSAAALALAPNLTSDDLEFVEIYNPSNQSLPLGAWRVGLGIEYEFDASAKLGPDQAGLLISFNPTNPANAARVAAFRAHYGIGNDVPLFGGYSGNLNAAGDGLELLRPELPAAPPVETIIYTQEDAVVYDDRAPWPLVPGASGQSLQRTMPKAFGRLASSWISAAATPGAYTEPFAGDLNQDGVVDGRDVNRLHLAGRTGENQFDQTGDAKVDRADIAFFVQTTIGTHIGDVNFDNRFDSSDLVVLFQSNEFEDNTPGNSSYSEGDWNLDGDFTTDDLIYALQFGGYRDPVAVIAADPDDLERMGLDLDDDARAVAIDHALATEDIWLE